MVDMSRSPDSAILSVRGIGVAESVSTSTPREISFSRSLWLTPKRCSSSTIKSPRSLKCTFFCSSLCVPMIRSILPDASSCSVFFICAAVRNRDRTSIVTGNEPKRLSAVK